MTTTHQSQRAKAAKSLAIWRERRAEQKLARLELIETAVALGQPRHEAEMGTGASDFVAGFLRGSEHE